MSDPDYQRRYRERNRERINADYRRRYRQDPQKHQARTQAWRTKHADDLRIYDQVKSCERRAKLYGAQGSFTIQEWADKLAVYGGACHWCRQTISGRPQTDHVIALSRGGSNFIENVVPSCQACNLSKKARLPREWRPEIALL